MMPASIEAPVQGKTQNFCPPWNIAHCAPGGEVGLAVVLQSAEQKPCGAPALTVMHADPAWQALF